MNSELFQFGGGFHEFCLDKSFCCFKVSSIFQQLYDVNWKFHPQKISPKIALWYARVFTGFFGIVLM